MSFNKAAVFAVFNDADTSSASFATRLMALGIASRAEAKPFAMEWAAQKYGAKIEQGQRGDKLPRDSAAEKAMNRVLAICYPSVDMPRAARSNNKVDAVAKLLKGYAALTGAEKRRFLAQLGK